MYGNGSFCKKGDISGDITSIGCEFIYFFKILILLLVCINKFTGKITLFFLSYGVSPSCVPERPHRVFTIIFLLSYGVSPSCVPERPHRVFTIVLRHTTLGGTPLDG
jgi:hypothetical protein